MGLINFTLYLFLSLLCAIVLNEWLLIWHIIIFQILKISVIFCSFLLILCENYELAIKPNQKDKQNVIFKNIKHFLVVSPLVQHTQWFIFRNSDRQWSQISNYGRVVSSLNRHECGPRNGTHRVLNINWHTLKHPEQHFVSMSSHMNYDLAFQLHQNLREKKKHTKLFLLVFRFTIITP